MASSINLFFSSGLNLFFGMGVPVRFERAVIVGSSTSFRSGWFFRSQLIASLIGF